MDDLARKTLLYDFYGELLTERQREIFEDYYMNDLSYGEISEELGISRAAVCDNLKRGEKSLFKYEERLKLVERFLSNKAMLNEIIEMIHDDESAIENIRGKIINLMETM